MTDSLHPTRFFGSLRAEGEADWLAQAYVPPREFELMAGKKSILIMGEKGSGMSALEMQLRQHASQEQMQRPLMATWQPQPPAESSSSDSAARIFEAQAMDALALTFLQEVTQAPELYRSASSWAQNFMVWFVHRFLEGDKQFHLSRLAEKAGGEGLKVLTEILSAEPSPILPQSAPVPKVLSHLTEAVKNFGFGGIWVFVSGLDVLYRSFPDRLTQYLKDLLSILDIFENLDFAVKIFTPHQLGLRLQSARGVYTRRFDSHFLKRETDDLIRIVERRVALVLGREKCSLGDLCADPAWMDWLKKYAGDSPRGWLDLTRPILTAYLQKGGRVSKTAWLDIYRQSPPLLRLDLEAGCVFVGYESVTVSAIGYKLLAYLYENRHRPCSKSELYYRVIKNLTKEPHNYEEKGWDDPSRWEGMMDTALYRLRQSVEWDNRENVDPLYIISERGRGQIRLENTA